MRPKINLEEYVRDPLLESKALKGAEWLEKICIYDLFKVSAVVLLMGIVFRNYEFMKFIWIGFASLFVTAWCCMFFRISPKCPYCHKRTQTHYEEAIHPRAILYICKRCKIYAESGMGTD